MKRLTWDWNEVSWRLFVIGFTPVLLFGPPVAVTLLGSLVLTGQLPPGNAFCLVAGGLTPWWLLLFAGGIARRRG